MTIRAQRDMAVEGTPRAGKTARPVRAAAAPSPGWWTPDSLRNLVLLVATGFGLHLCYRLAVPFLPAVAWALVLAVLFAPLQAWLEGRFGSPGRAALVAAITIGLLVLALASFVGQRLVVQAAGGAQLIETKVKSGEWRRTLDTHPRVAALADQVLPRIDLPGVFKSLATWLSSTLGSLVKGSVLQLVGFCLTFYLFFFFLRDRDAALQLMRKHSPLADREMNRIFSRIGDTIYATIYGTLAVSCVQGLLGGLMFWWLDLPAPMLWGAMMALLGVVPVLGAFVVWIPAALYLVTEGSWGKALVLTLWGILVVGTIDNLLRPILVGNRLKMHPVPVFMSEIGGMVVFGPAGLIVGPLLLTLTAELLEIWSDRSSLQAGHADHSAGP